MWYHLMIHLYEEGSLEDVLTALASLGMDHAVVVDGQRMSRLLAFDVPIFAGFREEVSQRSSYCKLISAVTESPAVLDELLRLLKGAGIDFEQEGVGLMILTPIERMVGTRAGWT